MNPFNSLFSGNGQPAGLSADALNALVLASSQNNTTLPNSFQHHATAPDATQDTNHQILRVLAAALLAQQVNVGGGIGGVGLGVTAPPPLLSPPRPPPPQQQCPSRGFTAVHPQRNALPTASPPQPPARELDRWPSQFSAGVALAPDGSSDSDLPPKRRKQNSRKRSPADMNRRPTPPTTTATNLPVPIPIVPIAPAPAIAGMQLPVVCNSIEGILHMDQQVVECFCDVCEDRVASGFNRPIWSLTRFERHCGSKAKKWRLSLKIRPGSVPECPAGSHPMPLGQWLDVMQLSEWGTIAPVGVLDATSTHHYNYGHLLKTNNNTNNNTNNGSPKQSSGDRGGVGGGAPHHLASSNAPTPTTTVATMEWARERKKELEDAIQLTSAPTNNSSCGGNGDAADINPNMQMALHKAIFSFVQGVVAGNEEESAELNEVYLPWLNDMAPYRLFNEASTMRGYAEQCCEHQTGAISGVAGIKMAKQYLSAVISKIQRGGVTGNGGSNGNNGGDVVEGGTTDETMTVAKNDEQLQ